MSKVGQCVAMAFERGALESNQVVHVADQSAQFPGLILAEQFTFAGFDRAKLLRDLEIVRAESTSVTR